MSGGDWKGRCHRAGIAPLTKNESTPNRDAHLWRGRPAKTASDLSTAVYHERPPKVLPPLMAISPQGADRHFGTEVQQQLAEALILAEDAQRSFVPTAVPVLLIRWLRVAQQSSIKVARTDSMRCSSASLAHTSARFGSASWRDSSHRAGPSCARDLERSPFGLTRREFLWPRG